MHEEIEDYIPLYSPFDIFLLALYDIIIIVSCLPFTIISFYEGWQNDLVKMNAGPYRFPKFWMLLSVLILLLLAFVSIKKNIYIKLIGSTCIFAILQWVTANSIPDRRLEYTLLSPLKEQCYALLKLVPIIALGLCFIFLLLISIFRRDSHFEPGETKANRIVIIVIWILFFFVIPEILRPFITIWL